MTRRAAPQRGLVYYPRSHRYKLDGTWVPGVTTVLGVLNKPAIAKWAASQVAEYVADHRDTIDALHAAGRGPLVAALKEIPWQRRDDAASRGTRLHDFADQIVRGVEVDVPDELVPVVENVVRFMDEWAIEPVLVEQVVASRTHRYAGTLDLIARYRHPATGATGCAIWDYKSGKRIYASTAFQLAAYAGAEFYGERGDEHPLPKVDSAFGVHIRADDYDVVPLPLGVGIFREFLTIREAFDINKRAEGKWDEPGSGYVGAPIRTAELADAS